jgi:hypothetical protein
MPKIKPLRLNNIEQAPPPPQPPIFQVHHLLVNKKTLALARLEVFFILLNKYIIFLNLHRPNYEPSIHQARLETLVYLWRDNTIIHILLV